ncbi:MAG: lipopolysaccharide biosynthesis protein [Bacteroidaceae bacterium]|nr:lipopolysaccharide biosynthesis protein [Bacteroidaceae bacterium]
MEISESNKRIAKNTLILYVRMFLMMLVGLYTSRVNLAALGVDNFGVYNVVGGFVAMFSIISTSLSGAISRFITYELGRGGGDKLKTMFSTSVNIMAGLSLLIVIIAELLGPWFIDTQLDIPAGREIAAQWVFQFSILNFVVGLISVPYNAAIVAHERMSAFAYISIFEALGKLAVALLIPYSPIDKLIFYAGLLCSISLIIRFIYGYYCKRHFAECTYTFTFDKSIFKQMGGFAGWNFFNSTAYIFNNQGVNMLLNMFFGVAVNAARGIAVSVDNIVNQFVGNFTIAINPQITKSYASGDLAHMHKLVCRGAKFSYFCMFLLALPIILGAEQILDLWLVDVPKYTVQFVQLILIVSLCDCIGRTGYTACMATGRLKKYSLVITSVAILEFPLVWIAFSLGATPLYAYYIYVFVKIAALIARMFLMEEMVHLKVKMYATHVFLPIILTTSVGMVVPVTLNLIMEPGLLRLLVVSIVSVLSVGVSTLYLGMTEGERQVILNSVRTVIGKFIK